MKGFFSNLTKILLLTFGALIFMGNGCSTTEQEKKKYYNEGYQKGHVDGYEKGLAYGKRVGKTEGQDIGFKDGEKVGYEAGLKEGKEKGWRDGYLSGSLAFAKNSWMPTLGLVITVLLGILLFFILRRLLREYVESIKTYYNLKIKVNSEIYDLAKMKAKNLTKDYSYTKSSLEALESLRSNLEKAKKDHIEIKIDAANHEGHDEAVNNLVACKSKLQKADELIQEVMLTIKRDNIIQRENSILRLLKSIKSDKSFSSRTKERLFEQFMTN